LDEQIEQIIACYNAYRDVEWDKNRQEAKNGFLSGVAHLVIGSCSRIRSRNLTITLRWFINIVILKYY